MGFSSKMWRHLENNMFDEDMREDLLNGANLLLEVFEEEETQKEPL
jgi:hypothetical protein